jgi:diketogulonate reductase-like aldo/keto reductase
VNFKLNNGITIPSIGLGTWKMDDNTAKRSVLDALECGYRLIDTASIYRNEAGVGAALQESTVDRDEIFITTKIWNDEHDDVHAAFNRSLDALKLEYVDLYLIHWPSSEGIHLKTWEVLNRLLEEGRTRSIGVSNYNIAQLKELTQKSGVTPSVNQVPISPFKVSTQFFEINPSAELINYCGQEGIIVEAYSPLTHGIELQNPTLLQLAEKHNKTPAQILLRWGHQRNLVVIPKSQHKERIKENFNIFDFEIQSEEMEILKHI